MCTYQNNGEGLVAAVDEDLLGLLEVRDPAVRHQQHDGVLVTLRGGKWCHFIKWKMERHNLLSFVLKVTL